MIKKNILLSLFAVCCGVPEVQIVEVESVACVSGCAHNPWIGGIDKDRLPNCEKVFKSQRCCAFQFTNSGSNMDSQWSKGQIGRTTTCPPKVKP